MLRILTVLATLLAAMPAWAADDDIPENLQGRWVSEGEACDASGAPMTISATTLVYADGTIDDVFFSPEDGSNGAIHLREEGVVSNYDYVEATDTLVFHPEGFGMGSAFAMVRCQERTSILERRCGWLANLTAGNWWLVDADNTWILSEKGDDSPAVTTVMDMVPAFDEAQYVSTGKYYGYGCACMTVTTDSAQDRILAITSSKREPLATCQADQSLPAIIE
jgi:hypothetical protein